jgi:penicillin-binding protein 1C
VIARATSSRVRRALMAAATGALLGGALLALAWAVPLPERLGVPPSTVVEYRDGQAAHVFLSADDKWRMPVQLAEVDPAYVEALIRLEDKRFHRHPGVDGVALGRAVVQNLLRGRRVSGASTLTMQLVRVLEPRPRTFRSKAVEALRALQLELRLSKAEILTAYLQHVPYGGNVEGVESAAWSYFGHRASALSPAEMATLLAVPQNPARRAPTAANSARLKAARDDIAHRLLREGALPLGPRSAPSSSAQVQRTVESTPVPSAVRPFPRDAPHLAYWLRQRRPGQTRLPTTLDRGTQALAERSLASYGDELRRKDIRHAAIVVVDHAHAEVRALVGGMDFFAAEPGAQLAAFDVPRSPGSALKPFVYALGIERGVAGPGQLVMDVPVAFGGYAPRNYDGRFGGLVRLEDALSRSLNVPFVNLLQELGAERFVADLRMWGVSSLEDAPGHYGLSVAVGGLELTALELASVYTVLARGGTFEPLRLEPRATEATAPPRVLSEGAAYLTRRALALRDRPDFPARRRHAAVPRGIHWKTGTSFGNRDAWAAGSDARHTAVVWTGNLDMKQSPALVGAEAAGPILFDVLEGVADRTRPAYGEPVPRDLAQVEVCAYSGHLPGRACESTRAVLALRSAVPTRPCPYHVALEVDKATGRAVSPTCRAGREVETRSYVVWPASVRRWLGDQHRLLPSPPTLAEGCQPGGPRRAPRIVSPPDGQVALLLAGVAATDQEIPLEADAPAHARLSWFVNGEFLGASRADERLWWTPAPGRHEILVSDEAGMSTRRVLLVRARVQ